MSVYSNSARDFHVSFSSGVLSCHVLPGWSRKDWVHNKHAAPQHLLLARSLQKTRLSRNKNKEFTVLSRGKESSGLQLRNLSPNSLSTPSLNPTEVLANRDLPDLHPVVPLLALALVDADDDYAIVSDDEWCSPTEEISQLS
ncbi:hypothetical protein E4T56_gene10562 [Termitomyces sp. T112]|nr:hypothetical protein E4T56_gene10562 [Termitomyces sp. T112]